MNAKRAFQWAGYYFVLSGIATVLGLGMVGAAAYLGYDNYQAASSTTAALGDSLGPIVLAVVGLVVWRLGHAVAFYKTLTAAVEDELSDTYDTEHVKADILSVLDDRLADMQLELQTMKSSMSDMARETEAGTDGDAGFEFDG